MFDAKKHLRDVREAELVTLRDKITALTRQLAERDALIAEFVEHASWRKSVQGGYGTWEPIVEKARAALKCRTTAKEIVDTIGKEEA